MTSLFQFCRVALNHLLRGGQRVLVALLCIAFGVMALVSMTMLSQCIESTLVVKPAEMLGGDASMGRTSDPYLLPEHVEQLKAMQQSGEIARYTLIAYNSLLMFHTPGSGEIHIASTAMGISPSEYPLAGALAIGQPADTRLTTLLQQVGDVVVTRDIAQEYNLKVGDPLVLADYQYGTPLTGTVRGIAYDTPNHQGSKVYYSVETAQKLANGMPVLNTVIANFSSANIDTQKLNDLGWDVNLASVFARGNEQAVNLFRILLRGAGILGLLVGGIGIANTMQVLLRRRQHEIAILKTLGYSESDLRFIFSLEAGILGLAGSLIGAALGVWISYGLIDLFRASSNLLYNWSFSLTPPLIGVLVGTLTTVIFAYWAIVVSSQAKPMALLRNEPVDVQRLTRWKSAGLALLLAIPFVGLTSIIMKSVVNGIGVIVALTVGIAVLGGFFSGLLWLVTRVLPLGGFPLARMGMKSLRRRGASLVFAMIALFVGISAMGFGVEFIDVSQKEMSEHNVELKGYNIEILARSDQDAAVRQALEAQKPETLVAEYRTRVKSVRRAGGETVDRLAPLLVGRSEPGEIKLDGEAWDAQGQGVYVSKWSQIEPGSQVEVIFVDGSTRAFPVVGTYELDYAANILYQGDGLLLPVAAFNQVTQPDTLTYFATLPVDKLSGAVRSLGTALPDATVIDLVRYAMRFTQVYKNLFVLAMSMAGMALLAGILLVANSVSLAMLDRRYEIGVLKTVGYSRWQVLAAFAVEYTLVGVIASVTGLAVVQIFFWGLAIANQLAASLFQFTALSVAAILLAGIGLTLLTVLGVTWNPTRVSPVAVLSERN